MKIKSKCTEVISSSHPEQIILYGKVSNNEVKNEMCATLEKNISNNNTYNDNISISKFKSSEEKPLSQSNTSYVLAVENQSHLVDHLNESTFVDTFSTNNSCSAERTDLDEAFEKCLKDTFSINNSCSAEQTGFIDTFSTNSSCSAERTDLDDAFEKCLIDTFSINSSCSAERTGFIDTFSTNNSCSAERTDLDDAFEKCLSDINNGLTSDGNVFNGLDNFNDNCSTSEVQSNSHNHKRKLLLPNICISSCGISCGSVYLKKIKKVRTIKDCPNAVSSQNSQTFQKITYSIPRNFANPGLQVIRHTSETFLQKEICLDLPTRKIDMCIECRVYQMRTDGNDHDSIICRFYAFRQLKFTKSGRLVVAGYPNPYKTMSQGDLGIWLPRPKLSTRISDKFIIEASRKILEDTASEFCRFVNDEKEALKLNWANERKNRKIVWKKCVSGVREMCDVCKTSIFNYHWSCGKCGFVVCVDCYRNKLDDNNKCIIVASVRRHDKNMWLLCSDHVEHQVDQLSITQILAGDALTRVWSLVHETCYSNNIPINCNCRQPLRRFIPTNSIDLKPCKMILEATKIYHNHEVTEPSSITAVIQNTHYEYNKLLIQAKKKKSKVKNVNSAPRINNQNMAISYQKIEDCIRKNSMSKISTMSLSKTIESYMWLCDGRLLCLLNPKSENNYSIFQEQWKRGQPVLVRGVGNSLNPYLWRPEAFSRDFGSQDNDLINCITSKVVSDQPMCTFWDGFENAAARLCDENGQPMLLKLKDWPPSEDFAETLPSRFADLMNCLPLKEYTQRNGTFNLAAHLPECFVPPDLGPKMYTAYGNSDTQYKKVGTTNLHLDMTDAVNVMVHVAVTKNCKVHDYDWYVRKAKEVIKEAGCDELTKERVFVKGEIPGALWHIYHASDADHIRDLLIKVAIENGTPLEEFSDPIHDQSHYLDEYLTTRLYLEYGVKGYAIVQCYGDAIFIPAGAPHQVKNLHNCIKVAEDFVSPENIQQSFQMTQEFRNLTDGHTNHEDKLQIKNIVFHAVKDSVAVLKYQRTQ